MIEVSFVTVGNCVGWSVSHCGVLVGSCGFDSFYCGSIPGDQLLQEQEAPEASVV